MIQAKRLDYFDMAKGIGILLVVIGHLQGEEIFSLSPYILPVCTWIFSFHMPLFFLISGMLICYRNDIDKDLRTLVQKRFRGIMVPYLCFSAIYMSVVLYALLIGKTIQIESLFLNFWYVVSTYGMSVLWFLPALFFGEILFLSIRKNVFLSRSITIKKWNIKYSTLLILLLSIFALLLNFGLQQLSYSTPVLERLHEFAIVILRAILSMSFISIGYGIFKLFREHEKPSVKEIGLALILLIIGALLVGQNGGVDFRSLVLKNYFFYYICAIATSLGVILLCKNCRPLKIFTFLGANSLIVMAVHNNSSVLYLALHLSMIANQYLTHARGYICYAIILLTIMLFVVLMIFLINRFFPFIVGKPILRKKSD